MKSYFKNYAYIYATFNILAWTIARSISVNQEAQLNIRALVWGPVFASLCISLSFVLFKMKMKNPFFNVVLGYFSLFPLAIILRRMYMPYAFNRSFSMYLIGLCIAIIYAFVVLYASLRNKDDEKKLNEMIKNVSKETQED